MSWVFDPHAWVALVTLTVLELVLGVDNIVFISILASKLPTAARDRARRIGLSLALITRILLLLSIAWLAGLTKGLFTIGDIVISGRDIILIAGGLFLIAKSTHEIHQKLEGEEHRLSGGGTAAFSRVVLQIVLLDIVFSIDSVITAVGMVQELMIMILAVVLGIGLMMLAARQIGSFVDRHPTIKMLALSFLLLIGVALIADGLDQHIPRGYIYFAMGYAVFVETLNFKVRKASRPPVRLHERFQPAHTSDG